MPLQPQIQSDVMALVATIPTVKEAVLTKQGLRTLRDEILYRHPKNPLKAEDTERLQTLGLSQLLMDWLVTEAGKSTFDDIKKGGPDALLQAFDAGLKQVELVQLTLAYVASVDDAVRFHKWFNQVLNRPVMLDIRLNPQLLAGVMFVYQNHLYDYSLRRQMPQLQQTLLDNYKQLAVSSNQLVEAVTSTNQNLESNIQNLESNQSADQAVVDSHQTAEQVTSTSTSTSENTSNITASQPPSTPTTPTPPNIPSASAPSGQPVSPPTSIEQTPENNQQATDNSSQNSTLNTQNSSPTANGQLPTAVAAPTEAAV